LVSRQAEGLPGREAAGQLARSCAGDGGRRVVPPPPSLPRSAAGSNPHADAGRPPAPAPAGRARAPHGVELGRACGAPPAVSSLARHVSGGAGGGAARPPDAAKSCHLLVKVALAVP
jgi:hypothetical protein